MGERELEGGGAERDGVAGADLLDVAGAGEDGRGGGGVVVVGAWGGAGRQDAGIVGATDDDADAALEAEGQEAVEGGLVEQGVAAGEEEAVEVARRGRSLRRLAIR